MDVQAFPSIRDNPDFQRLVRERTSFAWTLTIAMLVIYFGFILLVAFDKTDMGTPVFGVITLALVLGLVVIVSAIALTGIYVVRANGRYDELTRRIASANSL